MDAVETVETVEIVETVETVEIVETVETVETPTPAPAEISCPICSSIDCGGAGTCGGNREIEPVSMEAPVESMEAPVESMEAPVESMEAPDVDNIVGDGAWVQRAFHISYLLPWNWGKLSDWVRGKFYPLHPQELPEEYKPITEAQAADVLFPPGLPAQVLDDTHPITEPIETVLDKHAVSRNKKADKYYHIYIVRGGILEYKETKKQVYFSGMGTNKNFLSYLFGIDRLHQFTLYAGAESSESSSGSVGNWTKLAYTGGYGYNRIFKAVWADDESAPEKYIVITNQSYNTTLVKPSQRRNEMTRRLAERSDLSTPSALGKLTDINGLPIL